MRLHGTGYRRSEKKIFPIFSPALTSTVKFRHSIRMILLDAHTHLYDCFDLRCTLSAALNHLQHPGGAPNPVRACALTERSECSFFQRLENGKLKLPDGWRLETPLTSCSLCLTAPDGNTLWLIAGRQIKTAENLELSALFFHDIIPDGTPIREALEQVIAAGAVPSLNWALGKWLFKRGRLIQELIAEFAQHLILCDSSIRPIGWPEPSAFRLARQQNIPLLAGTDPLPCRYDEERIGSYATGSEAVFDPQNPDESFRQALRAPPDHMHLIGRRSTILQTLIRQYQYKKARAQ